MMESLFSFGGAGGEKKSAKASKQKKPVKTQKKAAAVVPTTASEGGEYDDEVVSDGAAFGLTRLPTGTSIIEATFGPDVVRDVDQEDKPNVLDVMDYIAYHIIKQDTQSIEIEVAKRKDEKKRSNIIYQVMMSFPGDHVVITSDHTDYLKRDLLSQSILRVTQPVRWYADFDRRRCVLHVTVNSVQNKTTLKRLTIRSIELEEYVTIVEHESDEQRVAAKRRRIERT